MSDYYPVFLRVRDRHCVIIGGGRVAERRLKALWECGARVTVVSPRVTAGIAAKAHSGEVQWRARPYQRGDLKGAIIAIVATNASRANRAIAEEAERERVLLNVADDALSCVFITPAVVQRGRVTLAISTGGASPALARKMRESLQNGCSKGCALAYADLADLASDVRAELRRRRARGSPARWITALDNHLLAMVKGGEVDKARRLLLSRLLGESEER